MKCKNCSQSNPVYAQYCFNCGEAFESASYIECFQCGTHLLPEARFCLQCGSEVAQDSTEEPGQALLAESTQELEALVDSNQPVPSIDSLLKGTPPDTVRGLQGLTSRLKPYLPENLYYPLERVPQKQHVEAVRDHLLTLLRVVKTYVPHPVALNPQQPGTAAGTMEKGAFLFADVKGFTSLYEKLIKKGDEGAEQMTAIINEMFGALIKVLFEHDGDLIRFGGDAVLGLFSAATEKDLAHATLSASKASLAMLKVMEQFGAIDVSEEEPAALRLKIGISAGSYYSAHLGLPMDMVYMATGETVNQAEQAEGYGEAGEIILHEAAYKLIKKEVDTEKREDGFRLLKSCDAKIKVVGLTRRNIKLDEAPGGKLETQIRHLLQRLDYLTPYLPANMLARMVASPEEAKIPPDYRPVSVLFVNFEGFGSMIAAMGETQPDLIAKYLNLYYRQVAAIVNSYDGSLARVDQYEVGDRFVIFFGAPNAHEDDPLRAAYTALEILEHTQQYFSALETPAGTFPIQVRIGINTGQLLAGNVGAADLRQEYTLMGDDINMAARLMSKAGWGEIYISDKTQAEVAAFVTLEDQGELQVKGKEIRIPTFKITGLRQQEADQDTLESVEFLSREDELAQLADVVETLLNERGQIVSILGDTGIGKSRLLHEFLKIADTLKGKKGRKIAYYSHPARAYRIQSSYCLINQFLYSLIGRNRNDTAQKTLAALWKTMSSVMELEDAKSTFPFLAYLLEPNLGGRWGDWMISLPSNTRKAQLQWALRKFFASLAQQKPLLLVVDNLQWADPQSMEILFELMKVTEQDALTLCFAFRTAQSENVNRLRDYASRLYSHHYTEIHLEPIHEHASATLLKNLTNGAKFSDSLKQQILTRSLGNPLYLREIVESLIENNFLHKREDSDKWSVRRGLFEIPLPASLKSSLVSRIDQLLENTRGALLTAAVLGRTFPLEILHHLLEYQDEEQNWIADLERAQFIRLIADESQPAYEFVDEMIQQVAYQTLLAEKRAQLHRQIAEILENRDDKSRDLDLLAYHYTRSNDFEKATAYLMQAAEKAMQESVIDKASQHYQTMLELLAEDQLEQRLNVLGMLQKAYSDLGDTEKRDLIIQTIAELKAEHAASAGPKAAI